MMGEGIIVSKVPVSDGDYVILFAEKLRDDNSYFKDHKMIIDSQISSSRSLFNDKFSEELKNGNFKDSVRKFLQEIGLLK